MPPSRLLLAALAAVVASHAAVAQEQTVLRLICQYTQAVDKDGKVSDSSGERLFTVSFGKDGVAELKKEGLGAAFKGKVSEDEIVGNVTYSLGETTIEETVTINRFTGSLTATYGAPGRGGLVFYGNCRNAAERLF